MKFKDILILEADDCATKKSQCKDDWHELVAGENISTYSNANKFVTCTYYVGANLKYRWCNKKEKENPDPNPPLQQYSCPTTSLVDNADETKFRGFLREKYPNDLYKGKKFINEVSAKGQNCNNTTKALWNQKESKTQKTYGDLYLESKNSPNVNPEVDPYKVQKDKCTEEGGNWDDTSKTCVKPENPELKKFRDTFDTKIYTDVIEQFRASSDQWEKMYSTNPNIYPVMFYSQMSTITSSILSYMGQNYRSSEFGLFKKFLDEFATLYGPIVIDENNTKENKLVDPNFFTKFGGTIDQVKQLSQSIDAKNTEISSTMGFDLLSDPDKNLQSYFSEYIITVMKEPSGYVTGSLQMYAWKYLRKASIPKTDTKPLDNIIGLEINEQNCLKVLDASAKYDNDVNVDQQKMAKLLNRAQQCLCADHYKNIGKLSFKDKFDKEKREVVKKRLAALSSLGPLGVSKANC